MSTPPGDSEPTPEHRPEQDPATPPMGYWEEQSRQQPPPPPPPSGPAPGGSGYGYPPAPGYGPPTQGAPAPAGPPPGYASHPVPDHPRATTALVLGLVAVVGGLTCGLPLVLGPWAWSIGKRAQREIDAEPYRFGGRGVATAGYVLGIVATVLLVLGVLAFIGLFVLAFALPSGGFSEGGTVTQM